MSPESLPLTASSPTSAANGDPSSPLGAAFLLDLDLDYANACHQAVTQLIRCKIKLTLFLSAQPPSDDTDLQAAHATWQAAWDVMQATAARPRPQRWAVYFPDETRCKEGWAPIAAVYASDPAGAERLRSERPGAEVYDRCDGLAEQILASPDRAAAEGLLGTWSRTSIPGGRLNELAALVEWVHPASQMRPAVAPRVEDEGGR